MFTWLNFRNIILNRFNEMLTRNCHQFGSKETPCRFCVFNLRRQQFGLNMVYWHLNKINILYQEESENKRKNITQHTGKCTSHTILTHMQTHAHLHTYKHTHTHTYTNKRNKEHVQKERNGTHRNAVNMENTN